MIKLNMPTDALLSHRKTWLKSIQSALEQFLRLPNVHYRESGKTKTYRLKQQDKYIFKTLKDNAEDIVLGTPDTLEKCIRKITPCLRKLKIKQRSIMLAYILPKIFDFEYFRDGKLLKWDNYTGKRRRTESNGSKWGGSIYIELLDVNTCPYCNRQYIFTVRTDNNKRIVKPALDHFFSQSKYPYLSVSLYNLIPSCTTCNSNLKKDIRFSRKNNIHPFEDSLHDFLTINIDKNAKTIHGNILKSDIQFIFDPTNKAKTHVKIFALLEFYENHLDYIREIVQKANDCNPIYLASLAKYNVKDPLQIYIGNYCQSKDINKRPLSKLTIDICQQFGLIP